MYEFEDRHNLVHNRCYEWGQSLSKSMMTVEGGGGERDAGVLFKIAITICKTL